MNERLTKKEEALESLDVYTKRTIAIKIAYLLFGIVISIKFVYISPVILGTIFLMIIYAVAISFLIHRYEIKPQLTINALFLLALLDVILITIIINFLGITLYIVYPFYIILGFMTLPRRKAIYLVVAVIMLYLGIVFFHYFQVSQPIQFFSGYETTPHNLTFVFTSLGFYLLTLLFLSIRCYDFYKIIENRINVLKEARLILEREKGSLEIKIQAKREELEREKKGLEERVEGRKKELELENKRIGERIEELEGFRKVAIGREIKVKELKKEINELKEKLK